MWSLVYIGVHTIISKLTLWKKICEEQENCFNVTWGLFSFLAFMNDVCLPPFVLCCVCHFTSFSSGFIFDWQFTEYLYIENLWDYSSVNVLFLRPKSGGKKTQLFQTSEISKIHLQWNFVKCPLTVISLFLSVFSVNKKLKLNWYTFFYDLAKKIKNTYIANGNSFAMATFFRVLQKKKSGKNDTSQINS